MLLRMLRQPRLTRAARGLTKSQYHRKSLPSSQHTSLSSTFGLAQSFHKRFVSNRTIDHSDKTGLKSQVTAVLGAQWGDEGKGKLVDILAQNYDICARFNGGSNAGHTLVVDGTRFAMHLLPCGVLNPHVMNVIGNGVIVHVPTLISELQNLLDNNIKYEGRLKISGRAHIVFDFHQTVDGLLETIADKNKDSGKSENGSIGTTRRGIGPTYASKMYRNGIRFAELRNWNQFKDRYMRVEFSSLFNYLLLKMKT